MALGGASKRPDAESHELLERAPMILFSLDADSARAIAYRWWSKVYPNLKLAVSDWEKPRRSSERGANLREWILTILRA